MIITYYLPLIPGKKIVISTVQSMKHKQRIKYNTCSGKATLQKIGNTSKYDDVYYVYMEDFKSTPWLGTYKPTKACIEIGYNKQLKRYIFIKEHKGEI